jgi:peptide/nickel transport system substrate-binding protein
MSEDTSRRKFLAVAGSGAAAVLAGCAGNSPSETTEATEATEETTEETTEATEQTKETTEETEAPSTGGTLRLAAPGPVQTLDPINAKGSGAGYDQYQESLYEFPDGDLPPQPRLATDFSVSNDGKTYTFTLKEGVSFHDGQEVTAQDFVYSWRRLAESQNTRNADDIIGDTFTMQHETETVTEDGEETERLVPGSLAVEAVDDYTYRFTLEEAFHGAISQVSGGAFGVIPENSVGDIEGYDGEYSYNEFFSTEGDGPAFAATGPFQVDDWSKGDQIVLSAFEDYYGEGPMIDGITYTVIGEANTRYQRFLNEQLDMLGVEAGTAIPTPKFDPDSRSIEEDNGSYRVGTYELENGTTVDYGETTTLDTDYIVFNCQRTPRPVRRAIAYLVNQETIASDIYKGLYEPAYHLTPPPVFMTREDGEDPTEVYDRHAREGFRSEIEFGAEGYPYGIGEARIDEATRVMEESDLETPYSVEFTIFSGAPAVEQIANRVRDKAQAAGIEVDITKADFGTIISQALNGNMDMFSLGDGMEWPESDNFLRFVQPYEPDNIGSMFTRWSFEDESKYTEYMNIAEDAWNEFYLPHRGPGNENQLQRNKAYYTLEETNWASVQELPLVHPLAQRISYPRVDERMFSTMQDQTFNTLSLNDG